VQGALAGSAARIAGGIGLVACAAVIALAAGGTSVFGGIGSLFGKSGDSLQVANAGNARADIVAAPATPTPAARPAPIAVRTAPPARRHVNNRKRDAPRAVRPKRSSPAAGEPAPAAPPAPTPALPAPPPAPRPGGGQVASTIAETVKQVASQAPPQVSPITKQVDDVVDALVQTCQGLPACP
jgi:hypothetical protein